MTRKRWYMLMLFTPLILPLVVLLTAYSFGYEEVMLSIGMLMRFLVLSSFIGGMPYFIFSVAVALWGRDKSADQLRKLSWWLPWMFMPVCGLFMYVSFIRTYPEGSAVESALVMMLFCVPIGFIYVIGVHLVTRLAVYLKIVEA
ncbi:MAG: hypothetical protein AB7L92_09270 [Alphaproteobacteria bacterium]